MFSETEKLFDDIFSLTKEESYKKSQVIELFALTSLSICRENLGAINLLLQNNFYYEIFMIFRHQIELMFRLNWIMNATTDEEREERVNNIEADSYRKYDVELDELKKMKEKKYFTENTISNAKEFIKEIKQNNSQLIEDNKFMGCGKNIEMAGELREKYYHQFKFLSMLSHPNPSSREYFLTTNKGEDVFEESFENSCTYAMKVFKENLNKIINLLGQNLKKNDEIKELQSLFNDIAGE